MENIELEITDRYKANGIPYPDPRTCCPECDGMGISPFYMKEHDKNAELDYDMEPFGEPYLSMYLKAEEEHPTEDGYHYLKCIACNGTGKRMGEKE